MTKVVLAFSHFDTGGLQTFMVRVAQWCKLQNIPCLVIYQTIDQRMLALCAKEALEIQQAENSKGREEALRRFVSKEDSVTLLTFEIAEFLDFERIRATKFRKYSIKHVMYNVSVTGAILGSKISGRVGKIIFNYYRHVVNKFYKNGQLMFMDAETKDVTLRYYRFPEDQADNIMLLPMFISPKPQRTMPDNRKIMTVARAVFPYKGYLIGLIKDFDKICEIHPETQLHMVAMGKDIDLVKATIAQTINKEKIFLYEGLSLDEICAMLKTVYMYIGMGTTVLDAADAGVPSVVVFHSTMENIASGYFHNIPQVLGSFGEGRPAAELILETLGLTEEAYLRVCESTFDEYEKNYNIDTNIKQLLAHEVNNKDMFLTTAEWLAHKSLDYLKVMRRRILKIT